jgi:hypothetical protein
MVKITTAMTTNIKPANDRCRRLRPRTTSAPQPVQTLAVSPIRVWQCGQTNAFTKQQYRRPGRGTSEFFSFYCTSSIRMLAITPLSRRRLDDDNALQWRATISLRNLLVRAGVGTDLLQTGGPWAQADATISIES